MNDRNDLPRPFTDTEYAMLVLNALKRSVRKSEAILQWIPPRQWLANEPDRRQIMDALDLAIEALKEQVRGNRL